MNAESITQVSHRTSSGRTFNTLGVTWLDSKFGSLLWSLLSSPASPSFSQSWRARQVRTSFSTQEMWIARLWLTRTQMKPQRVKSIIIQSCMVWQSMIRMQHQRRMVQDTTNAFAMKHLVFQISLMKIIYAINSNMINEWVHSWVLSSQSWYQFSTSLSEQLTSGWLIRLGTIRTLRGSVQLWLPFLSCRSLTRVSSSVSSMQTCNTLSYRLFHWSVSIQISLLDGLPTSVDPWLRLCSSPPSCLILKWWLVSQRLSYSDQWTVEFHAAAKQDKPKLRKLPTSNTSTCTPDQNTWCISDTVLSWCKCMYASCMDCSSQLCGQFAQSVSSICMLLRGGLWLITTDSLHSSMRS